MKGTLASPRILAPHNTTGSGQLATTVSGGVTPSVKLYLLTSSPASVAGWQCTTPGVTASFTPSNNPYRLYQIAMFSNVPSGTRTLDVQAVDARGGTIACASIALESSALSFGCPNPVVAAGTAIELSVQAHGNALTFTGDSWRATGGVTIATSPPYTTATLSVPTSVAAGTVSAVTVAGQDGNGNTFSAMTSLFIAPEGTTPTNVVFGYGTDNGLYLAFIGDWSAGPPETCCFPESLPEPAMALLQDGDYVRDLQGVTSIGGVMCYVMNIEVFGTLTGMP